MRGTSLPRRSGAAETGCVIAHLLDWAHSDTVQPHNRNQERALQEAKGDWKPGRDATDRPIEYFS